MTSGRAGDRLLDSYSAERQPVGRQVVDRANQSVVEMGAWLGALGFQSRPERDGGAGRASIGSSAPTARSSGRPCSTGSS